MLCDLPIWKEEVHGLFYQFYYIDSELNFAGEDLLAIAADQPFVARAFSSFIV